MVSFKSITKVKFREQGGRCYYCRQPMWLGGCEQFNQRYSVGKKRVRFFQATAEHLKARCEGGSNDLSNIVAACLFCNRMRHTRPNPPQPKDYGDFVRRRLAQGKWHGVRLA